MTRTDAAFVLILFVILAAFLALLCAHTVPAGAYIVPRVMPDMICALSKCGWNVWLPMVGK